MMLYNASRDSDVRRASRLKGVFYSFFFSSRRRHTRLQGDWSSDVCSSDLPARACGRLYRRDLTGDPVARDRVPQGLQDDRSRRHVRGNAAPRVRHRGPCRPQVHLRRQSPGARRPLGEHLLPRLLRPAHRALRVRHQAAASGCGRAVSRVQPADSGRLVLAVVLLLQTGSAATPGHGPGVGLPRSAAFDAATFDPLVLDGIRQGAFPGAALVIGRRDTILFAKGYGHLTWSASSPAVTVDSTLYDLASLTKVIATTPALMILVERGTVKLDAPVATYIPELDGTGAAGVTVHQLLAHISGLRADIPDPELKALPDSAAVMRRVLTETPRVPPGTRVIYSDLNAILLGEVVRRAAGEPLDQFDAREVFAPLDLRETLFRPPGRLKSRIAPTGLWHGHPVAGVVNDGSAFKLRGVSGDAGLFATATDVGRFAQVMLSGGARPDGPRLVRPEAVRRVPAQAAGLRPGPPARAPRWAGEAAGG